MAEAELRQPLSKLDRAALNFFLDTAEREDMGLELMLDAGDLHFCSTIEPSCTHALLSMTMTTQRGNTI
jgi:hypothetical protein